MFEFNPSTAALAICPQRALHPRGRSDSERRQRRRDWSGRQVAPAFHEEPGSHCRAALAVVSLVAAAFFATRLLHVKFLQMIGAAAILWIAVGLFRETPPLESSATHLSGFWKAMWFIVFADLTMLTDNILAVAAIAQGDFLLLLFGLSLSIPLVVFASGMLAKAMDNYPVIVYGGAALLGRVAGQMIVTDAFTVQTLSPGAGLDYSVEACGAIGVVIAGVWLKGRRISRQQQQRSK